MTGCLEMDRHPLLSRGDDGFGLAPQADRNRDVTDVG